LLGTGLFASQGSSAQALLRTRPDLDRPDVQIYFNPLRMDANVWVPGFGTQLEHQINAIMILLHPESRGFVTLRSSNPADPPRIQLNLLAQRNDIETLISAMHIVREIYATPPLADLISHEVNPGPATQTDAQIEDYMRRTVRTARHPVGSCRMGHDDMAVVDPQLRVRGLQGLRIADASIMPTVPGGNTNAPTIMIGEKAADLVRTLQ
jgi:choline dehydrogenase